MAAGTLISNVSQAATDRRSRKAAREDRAAAELADLNRSRLTFELEQLTKVQGAAEEFISLTAERWAWRGGSGSRGDDARQKRASVALRAALSFVPSVEISEAILDATDELDGLVHPRSEPSPEEWEEYALAIERFRDSVGKLGHGLREAHTAPAGNYGAGSGARHRRWLWFG